ncbi:MAG: phage tail assembly chaperone [Eubacteriales bacterium]|nr:phage tail assembly chaperone [Eubacteriales bacterium]
MEEGSKWLADTYMLITAYTPDIQERIESNYTAWMQHAKDLDYERAAAAVRQIRDVLLAASDKEMALDRMGLIAPTGSTFSAWLTFLRGIGDALSGAKATYRQALRDLPDQEGFPYSIDWPTL